MPSLPALPLLPMPSEPAALPPDFTHLEVHSHFSLLKGTMPVQELAERAAADNLTALALTDTNSLYGIVPFATACRAAGIKPILGMSVSLAPSTAVMPPDAAIPGKLVLLANGAAGYRSLAALASFLQSGSGDHGAHPLLDWDLLRSHNRGLICLTGSREGWLERLLRAGQPEAAARYISRLAGLFQERCYLSICPRSPADPLTAAAVNLGERFGLPLVAVQPVFCRGPAEVPRLRLLAAIDQNRLLAQVEDSSLPAMGDPHIPLHWPTPAELHQRFDPYPAALINAAAIAAECEPGLPDGRPIWPALSLPDKQTPEQALSAAAHSGLMELYGPQSDHSITARLVYELDTINHHGFAPLFLIVADIVHHARRQEIPVSTRGSVANSLVAYCLGITQVDPVAHDLLFERFLNPARLSLPDIDLDFCSRRRDEVLAYVRRAYGADHVALVGTMSTMRLRSAVRETAKAYGLDEKQMKALSSRIPSRWHPDPRRRSNWQIEDILDGLPPLQEEVVRAAADLAGQPHHLSIHPGGIILTPGPLADLVPVQLAPKGFLVTQYDFRDLEVIGLPKIDLLGIRALTVLADTADLVRQHHDPQFKLDAIPAADQPTAQMLSAGQTIGVFQCESAGAQRTLRQLKARTTRDLAVANAFFKPGPATGGMAQAFIRRYRGEEAVSFLHPALEPILGSTMGVLLFQEQILRIAREIAGLTWQQAEGLRKGMSKFQAQQMDALKSKFIAGCLRAAPEGPAFSRQQAGTLWEQVAAFAGYGFNQGHATAYGDVSFRSAYLKAHYPAEFLCARLTGHGGFHHPAIYMAEARRLGIPIHPPHVNVSDRTFTLTRTPEPALWLGLRQVRDLRRKSVQAIITERRREPFTGLSDLLSRVDLARKEVQHLICSGALDGLGDSRAHTRSQAEQLARAGSTRQLMFPFATPDHVPVETAVQRFKWESHILGMPVSVHPLDLVAAPVDHVPLDHLPQVQNKPVQILGTRLPGWTGGKGFYLADRQHYVIVIPAGRLEKEGLLRHSWRPLQLHGRWQVDEWGGGWFQAESATLLS